MIFVLCLLSMIMLVLCFVGHLMFLLLAMAGWLSAFVSATAAKQKSGVPAVFE